MLLLSSHLSASSRTQYTTPCHGFHSSCTRYTTTCRRFHSSRTRYTTPYHCFHSSCLWYTTPRPAFAAPVHSIPHLVTAFTAPFLNTYHTLSPLSPPVTAAGGGCIQEEKDAVKVSFLFCLKGVPLPPGPENGGPGGAGVWPSHSGGGREGGSGDCRSDGGLHKGAESEKRKVGCSRGCSGCPGIEPSRVAPCAAEPSWRLHVLARQSYLGLLRAEIIRSVQAGSADVFIGQKNVELLGAGVSRGALTVPACPDQGKDWWAVRGGGGG
jgi:hypothetical protein